MIYNLHTNEWERIKARIRKRDNYACQVCGKKQSKFRLLSVHHKIPFKISKDNRFPNLITCCISCHPSQESNDKIIENMKIVGYPPKIEDYIPPKWHLWVYGGEKRPLWP